MRPCGWVRNFGQILAIPCSGGSLGVLGRRRLGQSLSFLSWKVQSDEDGVRLLCSWHLRCLVSYQSAIALQYRSILALNVCQLIEDKIAQIMCTDSIPDR